MHLIVKTHSRIFATGGASTIMEKFLQMCTVTAPTRMISIHPLWVTFMSLYLCIFNSNHNNNNSTSAIIAPSFWCWINASRQFCSTSKQHVPTYG